MIERFLLYVDLLGFSELRKGNLMSIVAIGSFCLLLAAKPVIGSDCTRWGTPEYFKTATAEDVTRCLSAGADPTTPIPRNMFGSPPLITAAGVNQNPAVIKLLLEAGADPKARDDLTGWTPLHRAAANNNSAVITVLLKAGADPNALDEDNDTPLHMAAESNDSVAVIQTLLDAGADPKATDRRGWTALHRATKSNENVAVIRMLADAGLGFRTRDKDGHTLLYWGANNDNSTVMEMLLSSTPGTIRTSRMKQV